MIMTHPVMQNDMAPGEIVIVDDVELNRELLAEIFKESHVPILAANGEEAITILEEKRTSICAILLDLVMPVLDGMAVLHYMYEQKLLNKIPVFLITAETSSAIIEEAYRLGVMDVISKPIVPYIVQRRISSVIELFQARKRLDTKVLQQQEEIWRQSQQILALSEGMIEALSTAIEFRSCESGEHVRRIHDITTLLLSESHLGKGLTHEQVRQIALASIMHDIGKIAIPDVILNKKGRLSDEEFECMKRHTLYGAQLLERIPQMRQLAAFQYAYDIARHHHERWDGSGYPDGLKGNEISIWAQIVSLADVYDALRSKRVYKKAFDAELSCSMICHGECGLFNPELLEVFLVHEPRIRQLYEVRNEVC